MGPALVSPPGVPRLRVLGHRVHPALTHLPLGLLPATLVWDVAALWQGGEVWWALSFWTLALGLAGAVPAALTGLLDFASLPEDHPGGTRALQHLGAAATAVTVFAVSALLRGSPDPPEPGVGPWLLLLSATGTLLLAVTGWLGADLVVRFRVGVHSPGGREDV